LNKKMSNPLEDSRPLLKGSFTSCQWPVVRHKFTPLENPNIYVGDSVNRKHQLLIEGRIEALPFLTGFTLSPFSKIHPSGYQW
jgi:hypothetical protein